MARLHKVRGFKPYLMRYLHSDDPNYEPVLRDLLDHEHEVYDEMTAKEDSGLQRGERETKNWHIVFTELTDILTPYQVEQLFDKLEKDFCATCQFFQETPELPKSGQGREFRHYLMRYLDDQERNYEPVLHDLLDHENVAYDEMTAKEDTSFHRGERGNTTWEIVYGELRELLSHEQIVHLFARLKKDFCTTCELFHEMAEAQRLIEQDDGGSG